VLDWTNNVILNTQPSYTAQNIIPHFSTRDERSQTFRNARERSILRKNEVGSNAALGHVYSDWGQAALAVTAYGKEVSMAPGPPPTLMVHLSEAYRLTGQLSEARKTLNEALRAEPQSALALNADGNLNLDNAEIAADKGDNQQARTLLVQARTSYGIALQSLTAQSGSVASSAVVKTNLGEAYIADGNEALRQNKITEAKTQYGEAVARLEPTQQASSQYPFAVTDLGRAYQGLGDAAVLEKNKAEAIARYKDAQAQHEKAIAAHSDFAEAHHNLGDLFDDLGNKEAAKDSFRRAIKARPEQPASYYPLAVLIQREDPRLAAALASTYLKLEREVFKQGEKARNARLIERQILVDPPARAGARLDQIDTGSTTTTTTTTTTTPTTTTTTTPGTVPNLLQMSRTEALSAIRNAGYVVGKIKEKSEYRSKDVVIEQKPSAGAAARPGSKIELTINVGKLVDVPDVIDDKEATATRKITKDGLLRIGTIDREVSCKTPGEVVRQTPIKGAKVEPDTVVNLVLAYPGEDALTVPSLIGRSRDDAEAAIRSNELILKQVRTEETNREREGTVLRQKPDSGTLIARQCKREVEITVAIPLIVLGNYVGLTVDEARRQVSAVTLYADIRYLESNSQPGMVLDQSPPAGSQVRRRSAVILTVSTQPVPTVIVPGVVGRPLYDARDLIQQVGLRVGRVRYEEIPAPHPGAETFISGCSVKSQNPVENQTARVGSPVDLLVLYPAGINPEQCLTRPRGR
jgi:beta-lactam-binding protein with PASTA domain/predicted Zn-dependent protease